MSREQNRLRMPTVAAFVDAMREAFGVDQVTVTYASENGYTHGKPVFKKDTGGQRDRK